VLLKAAELVEEAIRLKPVFDRLKHTKLWSRTRYPALKKLGPGEKEFEMAPLGQQWAIGCIETKNAGRRSTML